MRKSRKMVRCIVMMAVIAAMFSVTAFAASWQASFTYNTQTKTSGAVVKNNYNNDAEVKSLSGASNVDSSICALQHGGTIAAYSQLSSSGGQSGRMVFTSPGQTRYGSYGNNYSYNSNYYLAATLTGCSFKGTYMRQNFSWTP